MCMYKTDDGIILVCLEVPLPPYIKEERRGGWPAKGGRRRRVLLPLGVGFLPPILVQLGFLGGEGDPCELSVRPSRIGRKVFPTGL